MLPHQALRRCGSSSSIISIARIFGAPVMEPPGKQARSKSQACSAGGRRARMVLTRWCTAGKGSTTNSSGTLTEPGAATRPISLRSRSTIIRFSARSFSDRASASASSRSASASAWRGRVPLIGRVSISSPFSDKNRSGDRLRIALSGRRKKALKGARLAALSRQNACHSSP